MESLHLEGQKGADLDRWCTIDILGSRDVSLAAVYYLSVSFVQEVKGLKFPEGTGRCGGKFVIILASRVVGFPDPKTPLAPLEQQS